MNTLHHHISAKVDEAGWLALGAAPPPTASPALPPRQDEMEDTTMPLESEVLVRHCPADQGRGTRIEVIETPTHLKVRVKKGMLPYVTGAYRGRHQRGEWASCQRWRSILQVMSGERLARCACWTTAENIQRPSNATLSAYFETDVQFRVVDKASICTGTWQTREQPSRWRWGHSAASPSSSSEERRTRPRPRRTSKQPVQRAPR